VSPQNLCVFSFVVYLHLFIYLESKCYFQLYKITLVVP
jgi:hypothetical protein